MNNLLKKLKYLLSLSFALLIFSSCNDYDQIFEDCIDRGIQYYKSIGSYPYLYSTGGSAKDKVRRACEASTQNFVGDFYK